VCVYICIIKSLHYTIGINNIVNHLYLNKNKEKRKEKGKKKKDKLIMQQNKKLNRVRLKEKLPM